MDSAEQFDLLVVGGGKAGKTLAMDLARSGASVAMVERGMIGGSCSNVACIPTKALVTSARTARRVREAGELGVVVQGSRVDVDLLRMHKQDVVDGMVAANRQQFLDSGLHVVIGTATFVAPPYGAGAAVRRGHPAHPRREHRDQHWHPAAIAAHPGTGRVRCAHQRRPPERGPAAAAADDPRRRRCRRGVRADVRPDG